MNYEIEYDETMITSLELIWGRRFIAPGGEGHVKIKKKCCKYILVDKNHLNKDEILYLIYFQSTDYNSMKNTIFVLIISRR